jgi:hypothetical protein
MKAKRFILLALLASVGTAGALVVARQLERNIERNAQTTQKQEVARWSQGYYVPVTNLVEARAGLLQQTGSCDTNGLLDGLMRERLVDSILALCRAYSTADFDAFLEFRLASPDDQALKISTEALEQRRKALPALEDVESAVRAGRRNGIDRPVTLDSPLGVLEAWWYAAAPRARDAADPSKPVFCQECWKEIAPHGLGLVAEWRRNIPSSSIRVANRLAPIASLMEIQPMLQAKPTLPELLQGGQRVLFAHCLIPVKMDGDIKARPVLVSFYWSEASRKFLPHRMSLPAGDPGVFYIF